MQKYGRELLETNYPISFHTGPDTWIVPFCWQPDGRGNKNLIEMGSRTHPFNGPFSGTTQVSRYQKGKTNLDFA